MSSPANALSEREDLYNSAPCNSAPCGFHSLDKDGVFVRVNETELRWLGYSSVGLGNFNLSEIIRFAEAQRDWLTRC